MTAGAALQQRQGAAADEVDLEAEQVVVGAGRLGQPLRLVAHREQPGHEAADVRGHRHQERRSLDRTGRAGRLAVGLPPLPEFGLDAPDLVGEAGVQVGEPLGPMEVCEGELGQAQGLVRGRGWHSS